jgi:hypothetical protein
VALSTDLVTVYSAELAEQIRDALASDFPEHRFEIDRDGVRFVVSARGVPDYPARVQMLDKARRLAAVIQ